MILASLQHIVIEPHLTKLVNNIISEEKIPDDWNLSSIINCFKGKGDPLVMGNCRGLKLLDHVTKIVECVIESIKRLSLSINEMQYGFMPGLVTMDAIFILQQMHEKHLGKHKPLYFAFADHGNYDFVALTECLEKVIWWAMRKLGMKK